MTDYITPNSPTTIGRGNNETETDLWNKTGICREDSDEEFTSSDFCSRTYCIGHCFILELYSSDIIT